MSGLLLALGLILFVCLVVVHEFGHFLAARRGGVEVEEFGIGFPPRAWGRKLKSGMLLSINWLPLGGFVRLKGEHDADTHQGSFGAASLSTKVKIMVAGVGMNLLTAFLLFTFLALVGMPKLIDNQFTVERDTKQLKNSVLVGYVEENSPASKAGLRQRDEIISVNGVTGATGATRISTQEQLPEVTRALQGQKVNVEIRRGGKLQTLHTQLRSTAEVDASKKTAEPKGYLGITPTELTINRSSWSAPIVAAGLIKQLTQLTLQGIGHALGGLFQGNVSQASSQVSGPVGVFVLLKDGSLLGYQFVLMIIAIISLTLAIMNVLPIPALDGGKLFVMMVYRALHKRLTPFAEDRIHGTGFALLMLLFVLITVVDIKRFW